MSQKVKIALLGYGKMGKMIENISEERGFEIVERYWDVNPLCTDESTRKILQNVTVFIDFTEPEAVIENIERCADLGKNIVIGTTGWYDQIDKVKQIVNERKIGLVCASN